MAQPLDLGTDWAVAAEPLDLGTDWVGQEESADPHEAVRALAKEQAALEEARGKPALGYTDRALRAVKVTPEGRRNFLKKRFDDVIDTAEGPLVFKAGEGWRFVDHPDVDTGQVASWIRAVTAFNQPGAVAGLATMHPETAGDIADLSGAAIEAMPDAVLALLMRKMPASVAGKLAVGAAEGSAGAAAGGLLRQWTSSKIDGDEAYEGTFSPAETAKSAALGGVVGLIPGAGAALHRVAGRVIDPIVGAALSGRKFAARELGAATREAAQAAADIAPVESAVGEPLTAGQRIATTAHSPSGSVVSQTGGVVELGDAEAQRLLQEAYNRQRTALQEYVSETAKMAPDVAEDFLEKFAKNASEETGELTLSGMAKTLRENMPELAEMTGNNKEIMGRLNNAMQYASRASVPARKLELADSITKEALQGVWGVGPVAARVADLLTARFRITDPVTLAKVMTNRRASDAFLDLVDALKTGAPDRVARTISHFGAVLGVDKQQEQPTARTIADQLGGGPL